MDYSQDISLQYTTANTSVVQVMQFKGLGDGYSREMIHSIVNNSAHFEYDCVWLTCMNIEQVKSLPATTISTPNLFLCCKRQSMYIYFVLSDNHLGVRGCMTAYHPRLRGNRVISYGEALS